MVGFAVLVAVLHAIMIDTTVNTLVHPGPQYTCVCAQLYYSLFVLEVALLRVIRIIRNSFVLIL